MLTSILLVRHHFLAKVEEGAFMSAIEVGEQLYEYTVKFTRLTEYGISMESLMARGVAPPPEGARFDVAFEGSSLGPKHKGDVIGIDYVQVRADGRFQLHLGAVRF
jgi:hypothetical protein